jgi:signal transduction histidine kinase
MMQVVNDSLDPLQSFEIEVRYFHPVTKKETWIQLSSYPHCEGNFIFAEGFVFDISDRKEIEQKLAIHTEKLEHLVQELAFAKEKAEDSDRLKSAFLANMSHEFRTPLSGIVGLLQFLNSEDFTPEERRDYINIIIDNGSYLERLIDDIIDVSKIEAKQMKIHPVELQLNGMMNEVRMFFESYLKTKNKEHLTLILDDGEFIDHCVTYVDRVRLRQVLNNLLSNAVKFTESGYIRFGYKLLSSDILEFFVEDTGIGMSPDQQKVVFERFGRAEYGNKRQYEGTGLGLAISRSLVQLMGGEIRVESNEGTGTTFYFTIPYLRCNCVQ